MDNEVLFVSATTTSLVTVTAVFPPPHAR